LTCGSAIKLVPSGHCHWLLSRIVLASEARSALIKQQIFWRKSLRGALVED
jgi:hypothetical protein